MFVQCFLFIILCTSIALFSYLLYNFSTLPKSKIQVGSRNAQKCRKSPVSINTSNNTTTIDSNSNSNSNAVEIPAYMSESIYPEAPTPMHQVVGKVQKDSTMYAKNLNSAIYNRNIQRGAENTNPYGIIAAQEDMAKVVAKTQIRQSDSSMKLVGNIYQNPELIKRVNESIRQRGEPAFLNI
jgi:hypothetical protein